MNGREAWTADPLRTRLRELRTQHNLSLEGAARKSGLAAVVIGSYERGDRRPTPDALRKLLRVYGYKLAFVPVDAPVETGVADTLRSLADRIDRGRVAA
ncbi:helix-turn-helix transcriptional regulator [Dactylosporangium sp. NPDC000244]|uniref:helix-turn-helix domain-containing protein n=1 Tax=Dactylosporangium sp. NPDC000244 TaxID=3154365 RepID=UPI00332B7F1F